MTDWSPPLDLDSLPLHRGEAVAIAVVVAYLAFVGATAAAAPPLTSSNASDTDAETLVGTQGPFRAHQGYALVLGPGGGVEWRSPEAWAHFDVDRLENGNVLAAFIERDRQQCGQFESPCSRTGFRIYDPSKPDPIVREWTYPVRHHGNSEVHDATMLPNGNVAVVGMEYERLMIVDESGAVTWQWNASSYYDAPPDPTRTDWLHMNDVDRIGDGRFLVSVRNAHQLLVIERGEGVVEVINEDRDPDVLNDQHNPQYLGPDRIVVADSHNDRVVELREDGSGEWYVARSVDSAGGIGFHWPRDADVLPNGHVLVTDTFNDRIVEMDWNGTVYWAETTPPIPYEADRNGTEYPPGLNVSAGAPVDGGGGDGAARSLPLLSSAYAGFVGTYSVPYWFGLEHFVGLLVSVLAVAGGVGSAVYNRAL